MQLPQFQSSLKDLMLMQTKWRSILNPVLANPTLSNSILTNVQLSAGSNNVNHLLQRPLQGWKIVRQRAQASIYDTQDSNPTPSLTLQLVSDNPVSVDLEVF